MELLGQVAFGDLSVSNKCVVVCDFEHWSGAESEAWRVLTGTQDEIGRVLARLFLERELDRIDDFGGVAETFLCDAEGYVTEPPRIKGAAGIFSFTPKNRLASDGLDMARVAAMAGYRLMVITVQKHKGYGKVWVLEGLLRHLPDDQSLDYYEDTSTVIDELKASELGNRIRAILVQSPRFPDLVSVSADRLISQHVYQLEVLDSATRT